MGNFLSDGLKFVGTLLMGVFGPLLTPIMGLFSSSGDNNEGGGGFLSGLLGMFGIGGKEESPSARPASAPAPPDDAPPESGVRRMGSLSPSFDRVSAAAGLVDGLEHTHTGRYRLTGDPAVDAFVSRLKGTEGTGKNPTSSAEGEYQFIDPTWKSYVRRYAKDYPDPAYAKYSDPAQTSDADVKALKKHDDDFKDFIFAKFTMANKASLEAGIGRPCTAGELYLAHQQGTSGAVALLTHPGMSALDALAPVYNYDVNMARNALLLNGGKPEQTAGQFAAKWTSRFDNSRPLGRLAMAGDQPSRPAAAGMQATV